jgi:hypothetical protein
MSGFNLYFSCAFLFFLDYIYVIVFYLEFQVIVYTQYVHHLLYGNQFKLSGELIVHKIFFIIVYSDSIRLKTSVNGTALNASMPCFHASSESSSIMEMLPFCSFLE